MMPQDHPTLTNSEMSLTQQIQVTTEEMEQQMLEDQLRRQQQESEEDAKWLQSRESKLVSVFNFSTILDRALRCKWNSCLCMWFFQVATRNNKMLIFWQLCFFFTDNLPKLITEWKMSFQALFFSLIKQAKSDYLNNKRFYRIENRTIYSIFIMKAV